MKNLAIIAVASLMLAACDAPQGSGDAPSEESPVAPKVVCEDPEQIDGDQALECTQFEDEVKGDADRDPQTDGNEL